MSKCPACGSHAAHVLAPQVAFEVRELQTALGLVAAGAGITLVPASVRRLGRDDIAFIELDEPDLITPIIMSYRTNDKSPMLVQLRTLIREFNDWKAPASPQTQAPQPTAKSERLAPLRGNSRT